MKYNVNDKVVYIPTGEACVVVATKLLPWRKLNDVFSRKDVFPKKDYLILREVPESNFKDFLGEIDVMEADLLLYNNTQYS